MTTLTDRLIMACENTKNRMCDSCRSLISNIREKKLRENVITRWRGMINRTRIFRGRAVLFVRNGLVRWIEEGEGHHESLREAQTATYSSPEYSSDHHKHQPLEELVRPLDYYAKLKPSELLLSSWPTSTEVHDRATLGERGIPAEFMKKEFSLPSPFTIKELEEYLVYAMHSPTLDEQLQSIPREDPERSRAVATMPLNKKKNRYKNNIPYDDTRVVLQGEEGSDYINASYIAGNGGLRDYIATQGPKESNDSTIDDFWRMIWQNNTNVIVMTVNLVENGRTKVAQYWPNEIGVKQSYGQVQVEKKCMKENVNWVRRNFFITLGTESREVVQYQFIAWPDHDVPISPFGLSWMIKDIVRWRWTGPPVIHCSAGLGRTGTILLVLRLLDEMRYTGRFHPLNTLRSLRKCRAGLLDNQSQYRFAHRLLLEMFFGRKTRIILSKFSSPTASVTHLLASQYMELKNAPRNLTYDWATSHTSVLNRDNSVLPPDGRQVALMASDQSIEYVNAVRVRGSTMQDTFIVTEHPKIHTISRCWKLAYMVKALAWIFLHDHKPGNQEFLSVLPSNDYGELGGVTVQVMSKSDNEFFTEKTVAVSQDDSHMMQFIQLKNWNHNAELPLPLHTLVLLARHVQKIRQWSPRGAIMISCSDGYSGSGLFVALLRLVADLEVTQTMDVYRTVQSILFDRPQFIKSQIQYMYLHDAAIVYSKTQKLEELKRREQAKRTGDTRIEELRKTDQCRKQREGNSENNTRGGRKIELPMEMKDNNSAQEAGRIIVVQGRETEERRRIQSKREIETLGNVPKTERHNVNRGGINQYGERRDGEHAKTREQEIIMQRTHEAQSQNVDRNKHKGYEKIWIQR